MSAGREAYQAGLRSYGIGFGLCLAFTLLAFVLTAQELLSKNALIAVVAGLAMAQASVQLLFFLHLGQESKPRWKLAVFWGMLLVVLAVVAGSIWIMANLDYHHGGHGSPAATDKAIIKDEGY